MAKKQFNARLDPQFIEFAKVYADRLKVSQAALVEALLGALQDGRLFITPDTRPDPFPGVTRAELLPTRPFNSPVQPGTYPHRAKKPDTKESSS